MRKPCSTLPEGFEGWNITADVHVAPSGKYVYASNRGHDSLVCFEIDESTGRLTYRSHTPSHGKEPQNFVIHPGGNFLLAANQKSDNIVVFRINPITGHLSETGLEVKVPVPSCLHFVRESLLEHGTHRYLGFCDSGRIWRFALWYGFCKAA